MTLYDILTIMYQSNCQFCNLIGSKSGLGKGMLVEEQKKLKQDLKALKMEDISSFMESLPSNFLTILRTE